MQQNQLSTARRSPRLWVFCLALFIPPILAVLTAIPIARTEWFLRRAVPSYMSMLNDSYSIHDKPCEVLIFGDSSALTGLMPWIIEQDTGARTCSIAQTKGVIGVTGLDSLREYLSRNPAPRVLVLAFAPEDWRAIPQWGEVAFVEGLLEVIRHDSVWSGFWRFATHPNEAFGFTNFVFKSATAAAIMRMHGYGFAHDAIVRDGQMTLTAPAEMVCANEGVLEKVDRITPSPDFVRAARKEFSAKANSVILVTPPVPDCDKELAFYTARLNGVLDEPMQTLPVGDFNDLDRHFTAAGAEIFSHHMAVLVHQRLQAQQQ